MSGRSVAEPEDLTVVKKKSVEGGKKEEKPNIQT